MKSLTFAVLLITVTTVSALPPGGTASEACKAIQQVLPSGVGYKGENEFKAEQADYWSGVNRDEIPACIIFPTNAEDVSKALKVLKKYPDVKFTVKSGGHDPNPGQSSVPDGVVIATKRMKAAVYSKAEGVVRLKPGGSWADAIKALEPHNVTLVGGRLAYVGIGGYLTGGGISFLTAQHGMAADSIIEFETVFPNGTIKGINGKNHPQLFKAMKGSHNNYGIVTEFKMKAFPIGPVWGGTRVFGASQIPQLLEAFHDFTENPVDPKAAIIVTIEKALGALLPIMFFFYDGPKPPPGVFKAFENIKPALDMCKTQSYHSLLQSSGSDKQMLPGARTSFRSLTLPLVPGDKGAFQKEIHQIWDKASTGLGVNVIPSIAFQSFPTLIGKASEKAGGNAMGLTARDGPRFIIELTYINFLKSSDKDVRKAGTVITTNVAKSAQRLLSSPVNAKYINATTGPKLETYNPYFINDAAFDQKVMQSYKEYAAFAALQKQIDPDGFFAKRIGGFKY